MKYFFPILLALAALGLAAAAAFFSVSGLSKMFAGAQLEVIIMASFLEFAKVATTAFLHRYWKVLKRFIKIQLVTAVIILMLITSAGIYGFLSNAYSKTAGQLTQADGKIEMLQNEKTQKEEKIASINIVIQTKNQRLKTLNDLRINQEKRLDDLYRDNKISVARKVEQQINEANKEIMNVGRSVDSLSVVIQNINQEINDIDTKKIEAENSDIASEMGSLKYISVLTGQPMGVVVNWFIMLLIFVFDPLAIALIIATNIAIEKRHLVMLKKEDNKKVEISDSIEEIKNDEQIESIVKDLNIDKIEKEAEPFAIEEIEEAKEIAEDEVKENIVSESIEVEEYENIEEQTKKDIDFHNNSVDNVKEGIIKNLTEEKVKIYLKLIDILYDKGNRKRGDELPSFVTLMQEIKQNNIEIKKEDINNFFILCNIFDITYMSSKDRRINQDYLTAKGLMEIFIKK